MILAHEAGGDIAANDSRAGNRSLYGGNRVLIAEILALDGFMVLPGQDDQRVSCLQRIDAALNCGE